MRASILAALPLALALVLTAPRAAHAQEVSRAQALFDEGRRLMAEGRYADACPKLAASQKLDPGAGTLMNLAACYEKNGQLASAWATLREASSVARVTNHPDWDVAARARADRLEPELPRLAVVVPPDARADGLVIERDGQSLDAAEWDAPMPVDAGVHRIRARAAGKRAWSTEVTIGAGPSRTEVRIPALELEPPAAVAPPPKRAPEPADDAPRDGSSQRLVGIVVASAGGAALATGAVFGWMAKVDRDDALENCNASRQCTPRGIELGDRAETQADISTIAFIAGGALVVGGVVLYLTAASPRRSTSTSVRLTATGLGGTF